MKSTSPPRVFYGYYIIGACFIILFMLWGVVLNTFPIFFKPIAENMHWSRGALAIALLAGAVGTTFSAPVAGKLMDRFGVRSIMTVGALIIGGGLLAGSRMQHLWQLYIIFGFIGCGLMCASIIPCSFIISNWFVSRRGMAMGFAFSGTSAGGMIGSWVANKIILGYGWRTAFALSGISILLIVIPVILLLIRTRPSELGLEPYRAGSDSAGGNDNWGIGVKEAFRTKVFWQVATIMLIVGIVSGGFGNHSAAFLTDLGHSPTQAAFAWSLVMFVMIFGKFAFGPVADKWGAKNAMAGACILFIASFFILPYAKAYSAVMLFSVAYGFACAAPLVINPLLTAGGMGMKNFGAIFGILNMMANLGGTLGPVGAGFYFDKYRTYYPVFYFFIFLMAVAALTALLIKPVQQPREAVGQAKVSETI
jgi:MFS family permease